MKNFTSVLSLSPAEPRWSQSCDWPLPLAPSIGGGVWHLDRDRGRSWERPAPVDSGAVLKRRMVAPTVSDRRAPIQERVRELDSAPKVRRRSSRSVCVSAKNDSATAFSSASPTSSVNAVNPASRTGRHNAQATYCDPRSLRTSTYADLNRQFSTPKASEPWSSRRCSATACPDVGRECASDAG